MDPLVAAKAAGDVCTAVAFLLIPWRIRHQARVGNPIFRSALAGSIFGIFIVACALTFLNAAMVTYWQGLGGLGTNRPFAYWTVAWTWLTVVTALGTFFALPHIARREASMREHDTSELLEQVAALGQTPPLFRDLVVRAIKLGLGER